MLKSRLARQHSCLLRPPLKRKVEERFLFFLNVIRGLKDCDLCSKIKEK